MRLDINQILSHDIERVNKKVIIRYELPFKYHDLRWAVFKVLLMKDDISFKLRNGTCVTGWIKSINTGTVEHSNVIYLYIHATLITDFGDFLNIPKLKTN
jgi:hypothetical protein